MGKTNAFIDHLSWVKGTANRFLGSICSLFRIKCITWMTSNRSGCLWGPATFESGIFRSTSLKCVAKTNAGNHDSELRGNYVKTCPQLKVYHKMQSFPFLCCGFSIANWDRNWAYCMRTVVSRLNTARCRHLSDFRKFSVKLKSFPPIYLEITPLYERLVFISQTTCTPQKMVGCRFKKVLHTASGTVTFISTFVVL